MQQINIRLQSYIMVNYMKEKEKGQAAVQRKQEEI